MYISGTISDFMTRLHELPQMNSGVTGQVDLVAANNALNQFVTEGRGYLASGVHPDTSGHWEYEIRSQRYRLTGDFNQMLTQNL